MTNTADEYGWKRNGRKCMAIKRKSQQKTNTNTSQLIQNIRKCVAMIRKCPSEDKHKYKLMNTKCKKMYGYDKEMSNRRQTQIQANEYGM